MGVVTVSSSTAQATLGLCTKFSTRKSTTKRPLIVAFKSDKSDNTALAAPRKKILSPLEKTKDKKKRRGNSCQYRSVDLDYNEAAEKLENIFKLSPASVTSDVEEVDGTNATRRGGRRKKRTSDGEKKTANKTIKPVVRNWDKKPKRLSLNERLKVRNTSEREMVASIRKKKQDENEKIEELVREYSGSTDLASLDWKKMKIPPVLPSTEHTWLFKLMQPMKALLKLKEDLEDNLGRETTEGELAEATNTRVVQVRRQIEVGRAARNKLIKHNLRLVLFVINKYFQDFANGPKFQDLCQAGVKGLITAIDRFEPNRRFRLSTYGLFWIRHAIIRSMTLSSFTRVSFGLESIRVEIQKAKLELLFDLQRQPTVEEITERVGISPERYQEVMRASKPVLSLHSRHAITQEEFINGITDVDGGDNRRQPALLRLALDDVLDSLKPKESLVIRQRYGLDGKGDRTLGEIAGNLNISREMVRKHEVKALMKLKHPARVDYLRRYVV